MILSAYEEHMAIHVYIGKSECLVSAECGSVVNALHVLALPIIAITSSSSN